MQMPFAMGHFDVRITIIIIIIIIIIAPTTFVRVGLAKITLKMHWAAKAAVSC